ncbi:ATP-binding cassette domain-containing protein [Actinopolymorpha sp. B11F2]|uniref:ATP-binding cassette domain-containing protein n=1 Tax=Actinopolymorpha sp. B11F2 TaxID=3160862 RepID=UPI0032E4944B
MSSTTTTSPPGGAPPSRDGFAIEARDLSKTYAGKVRALTGLSVSVGAGTVFALLGPNGAGKSTTVKILTTLTRPDAGTATVAGHDVLRHPDAVRRSIGYVSQKPQFDPEATGSENLYLQGRLYGVPRKRLRTLARALLERFGLGDAAHRPARTYSGGMQRKLDVALALVHTPKVLFLDEPTTGLDPHARADMWKEISRLASDDGLTILLTTHYLDEADQLAHEVAIVDRGAIVAQDSPERLKSELRGDAILVEFAQPAVDIEIAAALGRLDGIREISVDGASVRARADHGARSVPAVLATLEATGVGVASVTVARPSLDDVYLRYAGRRFDERDGQLSNGTATRHTEEVGR